MEEDYVMIPGSGTKKIIRDVKKEIETAFLDYSMSVKMCIRDRVSILSAENGKTTIQSGVVQFEIQSMPANDFPELPNTGAEETLTIKTGVLKDMIDRTLYAVSQDEKKPAHTGEPVSYTHLDVYKRQV